MVKRYDSRVAYGFPWLRKFMRGESFIRLLIFMVVSLERNVALESTGTLRKK